MILGTASVPPHPHDWDWIEPFHIFLWMQCQKHASSEAMRADEDLTLALARHVHALPYNGLENRDLDQLRVLILDHLGVCLAGSMLPWGRALAEWVQSMAATGQAPVAGTAIRTAPSHAAFVNATAAHGFEFDDTHDKSLTHAGAPVIATALAVGVQRGASGRAFLEAVAAGYEAMTRAAMATDAAKALKRGFHPTALFGGFGAAAAAGKLMGFAPETYCSAWGLVLSWSGGSMQFAHETEGTTVKRLHGGYGAMSGVICAELAAAGVDGPRRALDGAFGLCRLFGDGPGEEFLAVDPRAPLEIHRVNIKPYNCSRPFHSTIDALREAFGGLPADPANISKIVVRAPRIVAEHHMLRRPGSAMAAQYSLPFVVGAVVTHGPNELGAYEPERLDDERVLRIADMVEAAVDPEMEAMYPERFGSTVQVRFTDGSEQTVTVLDSYGTAANPMPLSAVGQKIAGLGRYAGIKADYEGLASAVSGVADLPDLEPLVAPLLVPVQNQRNQSTVPGT